jgi:hypothetical protein
LAPSDAFGTPEMAVGFGRYFGGVFLNQHPDLILNERWPRRDGLRLASSTAFP